MSDTTLAMKTLERITTTPTDEKHWLSLRQGVLTSTDGAALLKLDGAYTTLREVWELKKSSSYVPVADNDAMKWGRRNEPVIAEGLAEDNGIEIKRFKDFVTIPSLRIGSSFDYLAKSDGEFVPFEIKSVKSIFRNKWGKDFSTIPLHIEVQCQWQMLVYGTNHCLLGVRFGSDDGHVIKRVAVQEIQDLILSRCKEFWESIDNNTPPSFDFENEGDRELLQRMFLREDSGTKIDVDESIEALMESYIELTKEAAELKINKDKVASEIQAVMKQAEIASGKKYKASWKTVNKKSYVVKESSTRRFMVSKIGDENE